MPRKGMRRETQKEKKKRLGEVAPISSQVATNYGVVNNIDKSLAEKLDEEIGENWKLVEDAKTVRIKITINEHGEEVISVVNAHEDEKSIETEVKLKETKSAEQFSDVENTVTNDKDQTSSKSEAKYDDGVKEVEPGHSEEEIQPENVFEENKTNNDERNISKVNDSPDSTNGGEQREYSAIYNKKTSTIDVYYDSGQTTQGVENKCPEVSNDAVKNIDSSETNFDEVLNFWGGVRKEGTEKIEKNEKKKAKRSKRGKRNAIKNVNLSSKILKTDNLKDSQQEESTLTEKLNENMNDICNSEDNTGSNNINEDDSNAILKEVSTYVSNSEETDNLENVLLKGDDGEENLLSKTESKKENIKDEVNETIISIVDNNDNNNTDEMQTENMLTVDWENSSIKEITCDIENITVEEGNSVDDLEKILCNQLPINDEAHMVKVSNDIEEICDEAQKCTTDKLQSIQDPNNSIGNKENIGSTKYTQKMVEEKHVTLDEMYTIEKMEESDHSPTDTFDDLLIHSEKDDIKLFDKATASMDKVNLVNDTDNESENISETEQIIRSSTNQTFKNKTDQEENRETIELYPNVKMQNFTCNNKFIIENVLPTNRDTWVNTNLASYQNIQFDDEMGFGIFSEKEEKFSAKVLLKEASPFLYNKEGSSVQLLPSTHYYSLPYYILRATTMENCGMTVFMLKHFLHTPSLSTQQMNSLHVVACKQSALDEFVFIKPLHVDLQYVYIEPHDCNWFQVISNFAHLPICAVLVPFITAYSIDPTISICTLPRGPNHIRKMIQENPGWKKCGYEEPCVLNKGKIYQLLIEDGKDRDWCGKIKAGLGLKDMQWVKIRDEMWRNQAYVKLSLQEDQNDNDNEQIAFSGDLSLYHYLTLEQDSEP